MSAAISSSERLFRAVHHAKAFDDLELQTEKLWNLIHEAKPESDILETSVIWQKFAPTNKYIHDYGRRVSRRRNDKRKADGRKPNDIYCGAYSFLAEHVRSLADISVGVIGANVYHQIEADDEVAHAALIIELKRQMTKTQINSARTYVVDRMDRVIVGPMRFICPEDEAVSPHPSNALPVPDSGNYKDHQRITTRLWSLMRFYCLLWIGVRDSCGKRLVRRRMDAVKYYWNS